MPSGTSTFILPITVNAVELIFQIVAGKFSKLLDVSGYYQTGTIQIPFSKKLNLF